MSTFMTKTPHKVVQAHLCQETKRNIDRILIIKFRTQLHRHQRVAAELRKRPAGPRHLPQPPRLSNKRYEISP